MFLYFYIFLAALGLTEAGIFNKIKAVSIVKALEWNNVWPIESYIAEDVINHNASGVNGRAHWKEVVQNSNAIVDIYRAFYDIDSDMAFIHSKVTTKEEFVVMDVFKFSEGLVIEHWDGYMPYIPVNQTVNGVDMIEGPAIAQNLSSSATTRAILGEYMSNLASFNFEEAGAFVMPPYIQHNPFMGNGFDEVQAIIASMGQGAFAVDAEFYLAMGNFGLVHYFLPPDVKIFDLFRLENGFIAEHWDVIP